MHERPRDAELFGGASARLTGPSTTSSGAWARKVRTHHVTGNAVFEFLVATTNNLLRWMKHRVFKGTVVETLGITRLVHSAMQVPARIRRNKERRIIEMPKRHEIVRLLLKNWRPLALPLESG